MARLGQVWLLIALVLSVCATAAAFAGARMGKPAWVESARRTSFAILGAVVMVVAVMQVALLRDDFAVRYVAENSSRGTPTFFKVLALWASDDGSLLLWNLILAGYIAVVAWRFRREAPAIYPWAMGVLFAVQTFYLVLVNGPARPFATLATVPADGVGPPALLQNHPLMAVHPPFLYLGFIGFTVPFAFGIATLIVGAGSDQWVSLIRRWVLAVWCFLTVGLSLGALWSYSVLGWGGYWAWDPVENVALLPWLLSTAFLHSVMLQQRRGMAGIWNLALVIGAFALTTFGTFITRGSVLTSIHAFAESAVGPAYLAFLLLVLLVGYGLLVRRLPALRTPARIDSLFSREAAIVGNNVLLLSATGIILLGTVFPLVAEALSGARLSVGAPYFQSAVAPVFLLTLLLVGTAPLLPWRAGTRARVLARLRLPVAIAALVMVGAASAGVRQVWSLAGFGLAALVFVGNAQQIVSGLRAARRTKSKGAVWRGRRRYGGLLVHVGLAVLATGAIASSGFARQTEVTLRAGETASFAGYELRYEGMTATREPQRTVLTTRLAASRDGNETVHEKTLSPGLNLYPSASEPIGSPAIDRGVVWDLYASVIALQDNGGSATFHVYRNPGVNWLWLGALVMILGGGVAAWPRRNRATSGLERGERPRSPGPTAVPDRAGTSAEHETASPLATGSGSNSATGGG